MRNLPILRNLTENKRADEMAAWEPRKGGNLLKVDYSIKFALRIK